MSKRNVPATTPSYQQTTNKLADTVRHVVDLFAGEKRLIAKAKALGEAEIIKAEAETEAKAIRAGNRLRNREMRRQENIEQIVEQAALSLPPPFEQSEAPVSEDFTDRFFDESQDITDREMQSLWGKLLASEVSKPGSFHPTTLRALKYMTRDDAENFKSVCRFVVTSANENNLIITNVRDQFYINHGVGFNQLNDLEALGLLRLETNSGFGVTFVTDQVVTCGNTILKFAKKGERMKIGAVLFTQAGQQLSQICKMEPVPGFLEHLSDYWK